MDLMALLGVGIAGAFTGVIGTAAVFKPRLDEVIAQREEARMRYNDLAAQHDDGSVRLVSSKTDLIDLEVVSARENWLEEQDLDG